MKSYIVIYLLDAISEKENMKQIINMTEIYFLQQRRLKLNNVATFQMLNKLNEIIYT